LQYRQPEFSNLTADMLLNTPTLRYSITPYPLAVANLL
jgi:hypothetical protein